eukprot:gnl/Dysnectes_brevis/5336_a7629_383.p1 GENE.gnl/Dysnectes_brevis/5336_a7629_383~~gnl/Dysnectes_brevis/5336_a7629_383.p1  ORF type:complete len:315 (-),score=39.27 gnl/Dysnectes_brevis/5336_a7629_383:22-966(-)
MQFDQTVGQFIKYSHAELFSAYISPNSLVCYFLTASAGDFKYLASKQPSRVTVITCPSSYARVNKQIEAVNRSVSVPFNAESILISSSEFNQRDLSQDIAEGRVLPSHTRGLFDTVIIPNLSRAFLTPQTSRNIMKCAASLLRANGVLLITGNQAAPAARSLTASEISHLWTSPDQKGSMLSGRSLIETIGRPVIKRVDPSVLRDMTIPVRALSRGLPTSPGGVCVFAYTLGQSKRVMAGVFLGQREFDSSACAAGLQPALFCDSYAYFERTRLIRRPDSKRYSSVLTHMFSSLPMEFRRLMGSIFVIGVYIKT